MAEGNCTLDGEMWVSMRSMMNAFWEWVMLGEERRDLVAFGEVPDLERTDRIEERSEDGSLLGHDFMLVMVFWSSGSLRAKTLDVTKYLVLY